MSVDRYGLAPKRPSKRSTGRLTLLIVILAMAPVFVTGLAAALLPWLVSLLIVRGYWTLPMALTLKAELWRSLISRRWWKHKRQLPPANVASSGSKGRYGLDTWPRIS